MKSRAHFKGHPIHPILVAFPIAFFIGTFLSDLIFVFTDRDFFSQMAEYLEAGGILFTVIAAIPGIIDYFAVVPPESSAMKRATTHGILNLTLLVVFTLALVMRQNSEINFIIILLMELSGVIILTVSGWLGGTLVYRNQIGVDHRYADAGKWKEETIKADDRAGLKIEIKEIGELGVNQIMLLHVNGRRIAVGRTESEYVAFDDHCTHKGGALADGAMICGTVQCPWHGSQFNVRTGSVIAGPAKEPIKTYRIEASGTKYFLHL